MISVCNYIFLGCLLGVALCAPPSYNPEISNNNLESKYGRAEDGDSRIFWPLMQIQGDAFDDYFFEIESRLPLVRNKRRNFFQELVERGDGDDDWFRTRPRRRGQLSQINITRKRSSVVL